MSYLSFCRRANFAPLPDAVTKMHKHSLLRGYLKKQTILWQKCKVLWCGLPDRLLFYYLLKQDNLSVGIAY